MDNKALYNQLNKLSNSMTKICDNADNCLVCQLHIDGKCINSQVLDILIKLGR